MNSSILTLKTRLIILENNTISERDAKKHQTTLNTIKNAEIEFKKLTPKHKELLTDKTLESEIQEMKK